MVEEAVAVSAGLGLLVARRHKVGDDSEGSAEEAQADSPANQTAGHFPLVVSPSLLVAVRAVNLHVTLGFLNLRKAESLDLLGLGGRLLDVDYISNVRYIGHGLVILGHHVGLAHHAHGLHHAWLHHSWLLRVRLWVDLAVTWLHTWLHGRLSHWRLLHLHFKLF